MPQNGLLGSICTPQPACQEPDTASKRATRRGLPPLSPNWPAAAPCTHLQQVPEFVGDRGHVGEAALDLGLCLFAPEALAEQLGAVALREETPGHVARESPGLSLPLHRPALAAGLKFRTATKPMAKAGAAGDRAARKEAPGYLRQHQRTTIKWFYCAESQLGPHGGTGISSQAELHH